MNHALGGADRGNAEERAHAVEKQHQHHQHSRGDQAQPGHAEALDHDQNQQRRAQAASRAAISACAGGICAPWATNQGSSSANMVMTPQSTAWPTSTQRFSPALRRRKR